MRRSNAVHVSVGGIFFLKRYAMIATAAPVIASFLRLLMVFTSFRGVVD
jgi:hypothetical protein